MEVVAQEQVDQSRLGVIIPTEGSRALGVQEGGADL